MEQAMTDTEINIAIAEACGWKLTPYQSASLQVRADVPFWTDGQRFCQVEHLPDFVNDLNAMHESEKILWKKGCATEYLTQLAKLKETEVGGDGFMEAICATARQRAEAFLKTLSLWKETE